MKKYRWVSIVSLSSASMMASLSATGNTDLTVKVDSGVYPWIVQQKNVTRLKCTGILISRNRVLLPAHCLETKARRSSLRVSFDNLARPFEIKVCRVSMHPDYKPRSDRDPFDIAILELERSVNVPYPKLDFTDYPCNGDELRDLTELMTAGYTGRNELRQANVEYSGCDRYRTSVPKKATAYAFQPSAEGSSSGQPSSAGISSGSPVFHKQGKDYAVIGLMQYIRSGYDFYDAIWQEERYLTRFLNGDDSTHSEDIDWDYEYCTPSTSEITAATEVAKIEAKIAKIEAEAAKIEAAAIAATTSATTAATRVTSSPATTVTSPATTAVTSAATETTTETTTAGASQSATVSLFSIIVSIILQAI